MLQHHNIQIRRKLETSSNLFSNLCLLWAVLVVGSNSKRSRSRFIASLRFLLFAIYGYVFGSNHLCQLRYVGMIDRILHAVHVLAFAICTPSLLVP